MKRQRKSIIAMMAHIGLANTANALLPDPGIDVAPGRTALLITNPQNDFLSPKGVTWGVVGKSVTIDKVDRFSQEAGDPEKPSILSLCHFQTSSHIFPGLIT